MNYPRSLRSPRLTESPASKILIELYKVDIPDAKPQIIKKPKNIKKLLEIATEKLSLNRPAKRVLDSEGNSITSLSGITSRTKLYISCVEEPKEDLDEPLYKSRLPPNYRTSDKIRLPPVKVEKRPPKPEDTVQHQAIAASSGTIRENLRDSLLSLYCSLNDDQRSQLSSSPALSKLLSETRQYELESALHTSFIGPSSVISHTPEGEASKTKILSSLKGLKIDDCKFCITGPSQSGKSTLLFLGASLLFQKLELAGLAGDYLAVVINWVQEQIYLQDVRRIYNLFVESTMAAVRRCRKDLIPVVHTLEQWLKSLVVIPGRSPLPPQAAHLRNFPEAAFTKLGEDIWRAWNGRGGLNGFLTAAASLPANVAAVLGLKGAVLIYDHLEAAAIMIPPGERFQDTKPKAVALSDVIAETLRNGPCFVASQNDKEFFSSFDFNDFRQITTERTVEMQDNVLLIADPQMEFGEDICRGCPGYVAKFRKLCDMVKEMTEKTLQKSQFARMKSVVDIARKEMVKQELCRLCLLLSVDNDESIDGDKMNQLMEMNDITIRVR